MKGKRFFGRLAIICILLSIQFAFADSPDWQISSNKGNDELLDIYVKNEEKIQGLFKECSGTFTKCSDSPESCKASYRSCLRSTMPTNSLLTTQSRLTAYRPNTVALYQKTKGDQYAIEVNYSFRYLFSRPDCYYDVADEQEDCIEGWDTRFEKYFSYTGKFDFYAGGKGERDSGPVINRISNPAYHIRQYKPDYLNVMWIDLGFEHRSNGQTTSHALRDNTTGNYVANDMWRAGKRSYIDGISRGSNYISLEIRDRFYTDEAEIKYWLSGKRYLTEDSEVTWGDGRYNGHKIWDYDLMRMVFQWEQNLNSKYFKTIEYDVEYTVGQRGFSTDSMNVTVNFPYITGKRSAYPFFVRLHVGPMNELSNYTVPETSLYAGIALDPFPE